MSICHKNAKCHKRSIAAKIYIEDVLYTRIKESHIGQGIQNTCELENFTQWTIVIDIWKFCTSAVRRNEIRDNPQVYSEDFNVTHSLLMQILNEWSITN